jgi:archaellin
MKMTMRLTMEKRAEMGVGVLIVFIAMLLVAAIAAGVLITTVTSLQQKALTTGQETRGEISTHVNFVEVKGVDGSDGSLENFTALAKLAAGSDPLDLGDVLLSVSLNNGTYNLRYNASNIDLTRTGNNSQWFKVAYDVSGAEHRDGFLVRGDVVSIQFYPPRVVAEDESVRVTLIPKVCTQSLVEFRTPTVVSRQTMFLFP